MRKMSKKKHLVAFSSCIIINENRSMEIKAQRFSVPYSTMLKKTYGAKDDDDEEEKSPSQTNIACGDSFNSNTRRKLEHAKENSHNNCIT